MIFLLDGTESVLREVLPFVPALVGLGGGILATALFFRSRIYLPRHQRWQIKGLDLLVAGKPIQAERYYRAAMDLGDKVPEPDRVRLMVCLGESLIDQRRYEEAHQILAEALDLGDPIGSGQDNMCEVLLSQRAAPEKAIEMADEAMQLWARSEHIQLFGARWAAVSREIHEAKSWAHKARALLILGQRTGAQQAVDRALRITETCKSELRLAKPVTTLMGRLVLGNRRLRRLKELAISEMHWQIGLSLLVMSDNTKAIEHFLIVRNTDRMGKYRSLAQQQLNKLG